MHKPGLIVPRPARLWFGMVGAPLTWGAHLFLIWFLVEVGCRLTLDSSQWLGVNAVHAVVLLASLAALTITALAGIAAYTSYRQLPALTGNEPLEASRAVKRSRFMTLVGMGFSALFLVVIIYETIPVFILPPCDIIV